MTSSLCFSKSSSLLVKFASRSTRFTGFSGFPKLTTGNKLSKTPPKLCGSSSVSGRNFITKLLTLATKSRKFRNKTRLCLVSNSVANLINRIFKSKISKSVFNLFWTGSAFNTAVINAAPTSKLLGGGSLNSTSGTSVCDATVTTSAKI